MAMLGPGQLRVKRKRNEPAPDTLIVEPQHKRAYTDEAASNLQYVRQHVDFNTTSAAKHAFSEEHMQRTQQRVQDRPKESSPPAKEGRRTFLLARSRVPDGVKKQQRKSKQHNIATFVESSAKRPPPGNAKAALTKKVETAMRQVDPEPFKRPGKFAAVANKVPQTLHTQLPNGAQQQERLEALANELHQFTLDELASAPKPKVTAVPKLSAARSRDLHRRKAAAAAVPRSVDHAMADAEDGDYVYDTYVLAPVAEGVAGGDSAKPWGDIGYLIITEDDQSAWEAFIEDDASDRDGDSDDEDENAEDYYGADYPEDELASDDEFDRNAYGYRRNGDSDNEEWDEDTGDYSGDEQEKAMRAWRTKTPGQFAKYLVGKEEDEGDEGDEGDD
ncbi:hypothetical protein LTR08_005127 [Meristemomyces frigidus]|nr:hypothetical protein LTR08_005127 [Meristemomyces frigidus]